MNSQIAAFLRCIRAGESSQGDIAYHTLVYGSTFDSFADHPRIHFDLTTKQRVDDWRSRPPNSTSSAAGAYQATESTWNDFIKARGPHDFSPASQDECAEWLLERRHAVADILDGDLRRAIAKCRPEWQCFDTMPYERAEAIFTQYGGTIEGVRHIEQQPPPAVPAPAAQPEGEPMGIAIPLLAQLLPQVLTLFSGRAQAQIAKATGSDPAAAGQFMQSLITKVGEAAGIPVTDPASAVQAVAAVTALPAEQKAETVSKLEAYSLEQLAPMLDKMAGYDKDLWAAQIAGRESAAKAAQGEKWDMTPWLVWLSGGTATILVLVLAGGLVYQAVAKDDINSGLIGLAGPIIMGAIGVWRQIFDYRFDSTHASSATAAAQSAVNLELAKKA